MDRIETRRESYRVVDRIEYRVYRVCIERVCMILRDSYRSILRTIRNKYRRHIPILYSVTRISFLKSKKSKNRGGTSSESRRFAFVR